jgi:plasmid stabilization system protein ParE
MNIKLSKQAEKHLDDIYNFYRQKNEPAAINIYNYILDSIDRLANFPQMAAVDLLLSDMAQTYRSLVVKRMYKVIYYIEAENIHVAAVWDCRQNPDNLKDTIS